MNHLSRINNQKLLEDFSLVVLKERTSTVEVIGYIAELYKRQLYAKLGYSSLFSMLIEKYLYSKSAAYRRIQAAKVVLLFPKVLEYLNDGKTNLVSLSLIEPHVTPEEGERVIEETLRKNKEEIEYYLAHTFFKKVEKMKDKIRRLPVIKKEPIYSHSGSKDEREDLRENNPEIPEKYLDFSLTATTPCEPKEEEIRRVKIEFVADEAVAKKIERAKQILRHKYPQGKLEDIFNEALETLLEKKDPERKIKRHSERNKVKRRILTGSLGLRPRDDSRSRDDSRYIPQAIQREVYRRDKGQCSYESKEGKRCGERNFLEFDHLQPWSLGGVSTFENLRLLCRAHNQYRNQGLRVSV